MTTFLLLKVCIGQAAFWGSLGDAWQRMVVVRAGSTAAIGQPVTSWGRVGNPATESVPKSDIRQTGRLKRVGPKSFPASPAVVRGVSPGQSRPMTKGSARREHRQEFPGVKQKVHYHVAKRPCSSERVSINCYWVVWPRRQRGIMAAAAYTHVRALFAVLSIFSGVEKFQVGVNPASRQPNQDLSGVGIAMGLLMANAKGGTQTDGAVMAPLAARKERHLVFVRQQYQTPSSARVEGPPPHSIAHQSPTMPLGFPTLAELSKPLLPAPRRDACTRPHGVGCIPLFHDEREEE